VLAFARNGHIQQIAKSLDAGTGSLTWCSTGQLAIYMMDRHAQSWTAQLLLPDLHKDDTSMHMDMIYLPYIQPIPPGERELVTLGVQHKQPHPSHRTPGTLLHQLQSMREPRQPRDDQPGRRHRAIANTTALSALADLMHDHLDHTNASVFPAILLAESEAEVVATHMLHGDTLDGNDVESIGADEQLVLSTLATDFDDAEAIADAEQHTFDRALEDDATDLAELHLTMSEPSHITIAPIHETGRGSDGGLASGTGSSSSSSSGNVHGLATVPGLGYAIDPAFTVWSTVGDNWIRKIGRLAERHPQFGTIAPTHAPSTQTGHHIITPFMLCTSRYCKVGRIGVEGTMCCTQGLPVPRHGGRWTMGHNKEPPPFYSLPTSKHTPRTSGDA
jgi:hypothetical protein